MKFEIYKDARGEWRWRLKDRENNVVAASADGHKDPQVLQDEIDSIRREAPGASQMQVRA